MSILWDVGNYTKIKEMGLPVITSGTQNMGNGIYLLKAGTPLSNAGAVANTSSAKYLVAEDFYFYSNTPTQPKVVKLIEQGYVDLAKAEAASGLTFTSDAKSALATAGIVLVDGALQTGGGGGVVTAKVTYSSGSYTADVSYADLRAAYEAGSEVQMEFGGSVYSLKYVNTNYLVFSNVDMVQAMYASEQILEYSSSEISLTGRQVYSYTSYTYSTTEESGTYTLDTNAESLSGNLNSGYYVSIFLTDSSGNNHTCPVLGMKEVPGDEDSSYTFYVLINGSIAAFTATSSYGYPTYTP